MKQYIDKISELIRHKEIQYKIYSFDSGAFIVDIWINNNFYCLQLFEDKFGISQVTEDIDFSTIPDKTFSIWEDFETELIQLIHK